MAHEVRETDRRELKIKNGQPVADSDEDDEDAEGSECHA